MTLKTILFSAASALVLSAGAANAAPATAETSLNVRSGPGTQFAVIGTIPAGAAVDAGGCTGSWCQVSFRGQTGYANQSYLAMAGGVGAGVAVAPGYAYEEPAYAYDDGPYYNDYYDGGYSYGAGFGFYVSPGRRFHQGGRWNNGHAWNGGRPGFAAGGRPGFTQGGRGFPGGTIGGRPSVSAPVGMPSGGSGFRGGMGGGFRGGGAIGGARIGGGAPAGGGHVGGGPGGRR
ncbi:MAG: SH3 domain-containing protein [Alphaproteobacteria bacterium]